MYKSDFTAFFKILKYSIEILHFYNSKVKCATKIMPEV